MSSCLSGGGRTYGFDLELTRNSNASSPSSTLSESNSPLTISTRKPRTPRKRPNQTYNEAATLLSTAYPNIFSTQNLTYKKSHNFFPKKPQNDSDLFLPFRLIEEPDLLIYPGKQKHSILERKIANLNGKSCGNIDNEGSIAVSSELFDDFDAESILDEEIEEGIDSIMGNRIEESSSYTNCLEIEGMANSWYGNRYGGKFDFGFGLRTTLRNFDDCNWWRIPTVDFNQISPKPQNIENSDKNTSDTTKINSSSNKKSVVKKKKKKSVAVVTDESKNLELESENSNPKPNVGLLLKLNYDQVLNAWSDKKSPLPDEISGSDSPGSDIHARLAQIDLFSDGGAREACVLRYKEKRRTRLFSKKIRYQVRKVNADQRPRMKGRFVRRQNTKDKDHERI